jgi:thiamine-monophosphate kinase
MTVGIFGDVPVGAAITRSGGRAEDDLWISGQPGLAALGLAALQGKIHLEGEIRERALSALHHPLPRVELGLALRGIAHAMLDVSDGLTGDLAHLCARSACAAVLELESLPCPPLIAAGVGESVARHYLLAGGDDYELLFSAPRDQRDILSALAHRLGIPLTRIGFLTPGHGPIRLRAADGSIMDAAPGGYDHFARRK